MNNGRLWCVVNPTVGLPLFLGAVALTSLTVHNAVLNNTTWIKDYWAGSTRAKVGLHGTTAPVAALTPSGTPDFVVNVVPATASNGAASFVVTVSPKPVTTADARAAAK
jgi:light-harvesting protein B-800-850 alpha chain